MQASSLKELYIDELRDIYDAEKQLVKALPKVAKAASSQELSDAIEEHLEQTKGQIERLEQIFENLGEKTKGKHCSGMEGLTKEAAEILEEDMEDDVRDAALIAAAQRVEHYEIAAYGSVKAYATLLGRESDASLLDETLQEEKEADQTLNSLAESINVTAMGEESEGGEGMEEAEDDEEMATTRQGNSHRRPQQRNAGSKARKTA